jgi:2-oxoisovalerate dehydrogenase E1 component alpha subunit
VDADPEAIRDLAYSIIRVLNRDGQAVGPWAGLLGEDELRAGLRDMMILRAFDARMLMAQRQGKTSFYMQHMGEEAVSCAFRKALIPGDMHFPTYRQAGLLIAAGYPLVDMMCQIYSVGTIH